MSDPKRPPYPRLVPETDADKQAGRVPPNDLDAEAAVISACMLATSALDTVIDVLEPEHFYSDANRCVFEAMHALRATGIAIDLVTVSGWLRDRQQIQRVGGRKHLTELCDATPAVANVLDHARRVVDKWRLREAISTSHKFAAEGYGDVGDLQTHLEFGAAALQVIADRVEIDHATLGDGANAYLDTPATAALSTGIRALDDALGSYDSPGGLRIGSVYIIGAPKTGGGKTALTCAIAHEISKQPDHEGVLRNGVLYVSMEPNVSRKEITARLACRSGGIDFRRAMEDRARMPHDEHSRLVGAIAGITSHPWLTDDRKRLHVGKIRASANRARDRFAERGAKLACLAVDYLQLLQPPPGTSTRKLSTKVIEEDVESLVYLADDLQCVLLLVAALNAEGEVRYAPAASASVQAKMTIKLGKAKAGDPPHTVPVTIDLGKRRHGDSAGVASLWFEGRYQRFVEDTVQWGAQLPGGM